MALGYRALEAYDFFLGSDLLLNVLGYPRKYSGALTFFLYSQTKRIGKRGEGEARETLRSILFLVALSDEVPRLSLTCLEQRKLNFEQFKSAGTEVL